MSPMSAKTSINREDDAMRARLATTLILISLIPLSVQAAPLLRGKHAIANQYIVQIKPDEVRRSNDVSASVKSRPTVFEFADRRAKAYGATASNANAYVIDTGIYFPHNEFGGRAVLGYDSVNDGRNGLDCNGHGTHVAGTIGGNVYGVAKGVNLYAVRVLNCSGSGTTSSVIAGIDWVT